MPIKMVTFNGNVFHLGEQADCIVLRKFDDSSGITLSFPFHEDTPNFRLSISEAWDLKNKIDQLIDIKSLDAPRRNK